MKLTERGSEWTFTFDDGTVPPFDTMPFPYSILVGGRWDSEADAKEEYEAVTGHTWPYQPGSHASYELSREPETDAEWDAYEKNVHENHPDTWKEYEEMCADPGWESDKTYAPPNIHTFING